MLRLVCCLLILVSLYSIPGVAKMGKLAGFGPSRAPVKLYGKLHLIGFDELINLPLETQVAYMQILRDFSLDQESKWASRGYTGLPWYRNGDLFSAFALISEAEAAPVVAAPASNSGGGDGSEDSEKCDYSKVPQATRNYLSSHEHCMVGGLMVCFSEQSNPFHMWCRPDDWSHKKSEKLGCTKSPKENNACAYPAFMDENGGPVCVGGPSKITDACKSKSISAQDVIKKINAANATDKQKYQKAYQQLGGTLMDYCAQVGKMSDYFDKNDCSEVDQRLAAYKKPTDQALVSTAAPASAPIAPATTKKNKNLLAKGLTQGHESTASMKDGDCVFSVPDLGVSGTLHYADDHFQMQPSKDDGWTVTKCDLNGNVVADVLQNSTAIPAVSTPQQEPIQSCLARKNPDGSRVETVAVGTFTDRGDGFRCEIHYYQTHQGLAANGKCVVAWSQDVTASYDTKKDVATPGTLSQWHLSKLVKGVERVDYTGNNGLQISPIPDIVTNGSDICFGMTDSVVAAEGSGPANIAGAGPPGSRSQ